MDYLPNSIMRKNNRINVKTVGGPRSRYVSGRWASL